MPFDIQAAGLFHIAMKPWFLSLLVSLLSASLLSGQIIREEQVKRSTIKAWVGDQPWNVAHSTYIGQFSTANGLCLLQWSGTKVRGVFIINRTQSINYLYGDNSVDGKLKLEVWSGAGEKTAAGVLYKKQVDDTLYWSGLIVDPSNGDEMPLSFHKVTKAAAGSSTTSTYRGNLGETQISVKLTWYAGGLVAGRYSNLNTGKSYRLIGSNYENGWVYLDEWTDGEAGAVTARVSLRKVTADGKLQWQGNMYNQDKRVLKIWFGRTGSSTPSTDGTLKNKLKTE
ncbi:hypothetical protein NT6N_02390 [Oceaniferula spumae]|uniref:Membrane or secreted protein n=1 Tax=Oceaniferula spumae TaxID=2979115 RepID=A0AAT9FGV4_9BACT